MNKICKILGAITTAGTAVIAGTILYRKGYDNGFDYALRKNDDDYDFDDFCDDEDYDFDCGDNESDESEAKTFYCDENCHCLGFTFSEFHKAVKVIKEHNRASIALLKNEMNITYDKAKALIQYLEDKGYIGSVHGSQPREIHMPNEDF